MTESELYNALRCKCWNLAWFARKLYPEYTKGGASSTFYYKVKWGTFSSEEIERLNKIFTYIANWPI